MSVQNYGIIDGYIAQFEGDIKNILEKTREVIRAAAPEAEERISYRMPCFWQGGPLIYFAAMKHHLGIYPTASGMEAFRDRLATARPGAVIYDLLLSH